MLVLQNWDSQIQQKRILSLSRQEHFLAIVPNNGQQVKMAPLSVSLRSGEQFVSIKQDGSIFYFVGLASLQPVPIMVFNLNCPWPILLCHRRILSSPSNPPSSCTGNCEKASESPGVLDSKHNPAILRTIQRINLNATLSPPRLHLLMISHPLQFMVGSPRAPLCSGGRRATMFSVHSEIRSTMFDPSNLFFVWWSEESQAYG